MEEREREKELFVWWEEEDAERVGKGVEVLKVGFLLDRIEGKKRRKKMRALRWTIRRLGLVSYVEDLRVMLFVVRYRADR